MLQQVKLEAEAQRQLDEASLKAQEASQERDDMFSGPRSLSRKPAQVYELWSTFLVGFLLLPLTISQRSDHYADICMCASCHADVCCFAVAALSSQSSPVCSTASAQVDRPLQLLVPSLPVPRRQEQLFPVNTAVAKQARLITASTQPRARWKVSEPLRRHQGNPGHHGTRKSGGCPCCLRGLHDTLRSAASRSGSL